jgi:UDPglucose 6-dehydrogenase
MNKKILHYPLFFGLTHIGQVFSLGWAHKFKFAAVYDNDINLLNSFKKGNLTSEEPDLNFFFKKNNKKIIFLDKKDEIKKYKNVFFSFDTPLNSNGEPMQEIVNQKLFDIIKLLSPNTNLIILSQVYCGFSDNFYDHFCKIRKINLIYMVDTLIMGKSFNSFLKPKRLIFGIKKKVSFLEIFKQFDCPVFFLDFKQAEMVKISINLYLFANVTFANCLDYFCREKNFKFRDITLPIKLDDRIGLNSYLSPSLGVSGGHLERDVFTTLLSTKNNNVKYFFETLKKINNSRFNLLKSNLFNKISLKSYSKIIWFGPSYKKDSFSIKNSPYLKLLNFLKKNNKMLYCHDSIHKISSFKNNIINPFVFNKNKNYLLIYNYSNSAIKKKLKKIIKNNKNIECLNISYNDFIYKNNFKNYMNIL